MYDIQYTYNVVLGKGVDIWKDGAYSFPKKTSVSSFDHCLYLSIVAKDESEAVEKALKDNEGYNIVKIDKL